MRSKGRTDPISVESWSGWGSSSAFPSLFWQPQLCRVYTQASGEGVVAAKQTCPYECCVSEVAYYDKSCASGYRCENNICVAITAPCTEDWTCTDWSTCVEGIQTRTCTDRNNCGTIVNKSAETQACEVSAISTPIIAVIVITLIIIFLYFYREKIFPSKKHQWKK